MSEGPVWIDGSLDGRIDPRDRGLTLGDGVFDTLSAFRRIPFAGDRHLERLTRHAAAIGIAVDPQRVRAGWDAVLAAAPSEHAILRTTVTRGVSGRGLWPDSSPQPTIVISATPWRADAVGRPLRLVVSSVRRNAASPTSRLKSIGYLDNILAAREAAERGADDALLLNGDGNVACTTIANLFVLANGELVTPPVADGVMAGIVRGLVMEAGAAAGLATVERSVTVADVLAAEGAFVTNSVRFVSPVQSLDGRALAAKPADAAPALLAAIAEQVRRQSGFDPLSPA